MRLPAKRSTSARRRTTARWPLSTSRSGAGTDIAPLLKGLDDDACHAPHWGYMISGEVVISYTDGAEETCSGDDLFFWPAGHSVRVVQDAEVILFSPQVEHAEVMNHMLAAMAG